MPIWVERVCQIAARWCEPGTTIRRLFQEAAPDLTDGQFHSLVAAHLGRKPALVDAWETYSADQRAPPNPWFSGREVGFFDGEDRDVRQ